MITFADDHGRAGWWAVFATAQERVNRRHHDNDEIALIASGLADRAVLEYRKRCAQGEPCVKVATCPPEVDR